MPAPTGSPGGEELVDPTSGGASALFLDSPAVPARAPGVDGAPQRLGPWSVTGRWHAEESGQVLAGHGPAGEAELVVLGAGPMLDAAARDRFAAAVESSARTHPGRILDADPHGPVPWAALRPGSGPQGARPLLDAPLAGAAPDAGHRGPGFQPFWTGLAVGYPPAAPAGPLVDPGRGRRWWWLALVALGVVLLLLLAACWPRSGQGGAEPDRPTPSDTGSPSPGDSPSPTGSDSPAPSGPSGSPPPDSQAGATPSQPLVDGPGVSGPSFTADDATREMRLEALPFPFRVPATWGCTRSGFAVEDAVRWVCLDEAWTRDDNPPGGIVEVRGCPLPCDQDAWDALRLALGDDGGWQRVDVSTLAAQDSIVEPDHLRIRMSRIFAAGPDGLPDTHVYVELTSPPEVYPQLEAVVNDIRANTP